MSRQSLLFVVSILFFCCSFPIQKIYAQATGFVIGVVTDQKTSELLLGATIIIIY